MAKNEKKSNETDVEETTNLKLDSIENNIQYIIEKDMAENEQKSNETSIKKPTNLASQNADANARKQEPAQFQAAKYEMPVAEREELKNAIQKIIEQYPNQFLSKKQDRIKNMRQDIVELLKDTYQIDFSIHGESFKFDDEKLENIKVVVKFVELVENEKRSTALQKEIARPNPFKDAIAARADELDKAREGKDIDKAREEKNAKIQENINNFLDHLVEKFVENYPSSPDFEIIYNDPEYQKISEGLTADQKNQFSQILKDTTKELKTLDESLNVEKESLEKAKPEHTRKAHTYESKMDKFISACKKCIDSIVNFFSKIFTKKEQEQKVETSQSAASEVQVSKINEEQLRTKAKECLETLQDGLMRKLVSTTLDKQPIAAVKKGAHDVAGMAGVKSPQTGTPVQSPSPKISGIS